MANIHFFPGAALCALIQQRLISPELIENTFNVIRSTAANKVDPYQHFNVMRVYTDDNVLKINDYQQDDIIIAASAGGLRAKEFILLNQIAAPTIVAFEALGLSDYGSSVWHFVSQKGLHYASRPQCIFHWNDESVGHNPYMLHPQKDQVTALNVDPILIGELVSNISEVKQGYFYLYHEICVTNQTTKNKILTHVLLRCNESKQYIVEHNKNLNVSIIMDVIIYAGYARLMNDIKLMMLATN